MRGWSLERCLLAVVRIPTKRKRKVHCRMMQNLKDNHEVWVKVLKQEMEEKEREKEREATALKLLPEDMTSVRLSLFKFQGPVAFLIQPKLFSIFVFSGFSRHPFILLHFIGYPLTLLSSTNLHVFATTLSTNSPPYLSDLLTVYTAVRQLRSSSSVCPYSILWSKIFRILRPFYWELTSSTGPLF